MRKPALGMPSPVSISIRRCLLIATFCCAGIAQAQVNGTTGGIAPFGSYTDDALGQINAANLGIHTVIPIRSKGKFFAALENENNVWSYPNAAYGYNSQSGQWLYTYAPFGLFTSATSNIAASSQQACPDGSGGTVYIGWNSVDATGFGHSYPLTLSTNGCNGYPTSGTATDKYGYTLTMSAPFSGSVYDTAGNSHGAGNSGVVDPNGNAFTYTSYPSQYYTDPTGSTFLTSVFSGNRQYSWSDANGVTQTTSVTTSTYTVQSNFGCTGISETQYPSQNLPSTISLPDGSHYSITYEQTPGYSSSYVTGRIKSITLPTGGQITYAYNGPHHGISCEDGGSSGFTRTTPDGTWTYSRTWSSSTSLWTTVITSPSGQKATYTFTGWAPSGRAPTELEVRRVYSEANGTVVATIDTCYNGNTNLSSCATTNYVTPDPPTQTTVFTELPNSTGKVSRKDTFYDTASRVTRVDSYDFGAGAAGPLLQSVTYTYGSWNGSSCVAVGNNITDHPCQVTTLDGSGTTKSQVLNTYDSHGNRLTQQSLVSTGVYLTKSATYNTNGTVATATDVNGTVGTYSGYLCNGQFPGSYSTNGLSSTYTWDCNGGVQTSAKDPNNQTTTYAYNDPFWRLTSVTDPLSNVTTTTYTPNTVDAAMVFNSNASTTETVTTLDGIGRKSLVQKRLSPGNSLYDTVQYKYDVNGRLLSVSQPCQVALGTGCTTPVTTFGYDAAWRLLTSTDGGGGTITKSYTGNDALITVGPPPSGENTKKRQLEYDGLGRTTSVCEITSATGSGTCSQSTAATGYWTKYTFDALGNLTGVTQNAQGSPTQTRSYSYDGLSRMTSETNPENGTVTYTYDSNNSNGCVGTFPGELIWTMKASGQGVCFYYDALHRLSDVGNNNEGAPNSINPCKRFRYDNTTGVLGNRPAGLGNTSGRLAEAETDDCNHYGTQAITDEWFGYDASGNQTDVYESTPHSAGFYHATAAYWANGALQSLGGIGTQGTLSYGLDGEGRPYTATQGSTHLVTNTAFNAASQPLTVSLNLGDSDNYSYDPNTGRMTNYTFTVGSTPKSMSGTLTWNNNGTLQTLAITDGFNSGGTQTCNYGTSLVAGYDDLGRLASANCGSIWSQTFSYDPFGNITKSGSISWMPGYNQSTNRYTLGGTSYDADGNLLNDTFHTYTWDVYGKLASVDSTTTFTNDALGRLAEKNVSGTYSEIEYSPLGKACVMNGRTQTQCRIPLPGGAIFSPSPDTFWHTDWLGSARLASSVSQRTITFDRAFAPFGESYDTVTGGTTNLDFTGDTEDTVAGEYDTNNRELNPNQGRWISPDPAGVGAVDASNPQTWNRYAYVLNNPLLATDPSGLWCVWEDGTHDDDPNEGGFDQKTCADQGGHWDNTDTITGIFQKDGVITEIDTIWGNFASKGITLEAFDSFLAAYSANPCSANATLGKLLSKGFQGALNVGLATYRGSGAAVEAGAGAVTPWMEVKAGYDYLSSFGQYLSGVGQLYTAFSGDIKGGEQMQRVGDIISGPVLGLSTLVATGDSAKAQTLANYESFVFAGAGLVDSKTSTQLIQNAVNFALTAAGMGGDSGGCN